MVQENETLPTLFRILPKSGWNIDFGKVKSDLLDFRSIWKRTKWEDIVLAFLRLCGSLYDIISDSLLAKSYLIGTEYIKVVYSENDKAVLNCTIIGRNTYEDLIRNETEKSFKYSCFEKDPYWGWMTLAFVFLPGLLASPLLFYMIYKVGKITKYPYLPYYQ